MWILVNPLRVLLLVIVRVNVPPGVLVVVEMVRVDVPEPPDIVVEVNVAPMPAEAVAAGMVTPSFTGVLKPALGAIVTVVGWLPGGWTVTGLGLALIV
jgi:hypothetical protein